MLYDNYFINEYNLEYCYSQSEASLSIFGLFFVPHKPLLLVTLYIRLWVLQIFNQ